MLRRCNFWLGWSQAGITCSRRLEALSEATRNRMVGVVRKKLPKCFGTMGLASVGSTLHEESPLD
jgi:hypothetical protein